MLKKLYRKTFTYRGDTIDRTFTSRKLANEWHAAMSAHAEREKNGLPAIAAEVLLRTAAAEYIQHRKVTEDYWMQDEAKFRQALVPELGNKALRRIRKVDVELALGNIQKDLELADATYNRYRMCLHTFFEWAIDKEYCEANPVSRVEAKAETRRGAHIPDELVAAYVAEAAAAGGLNRKFLRSRMKQQGLEYSAFAEIMGKPAKEVGLFLRQTAPSIAQVEGLCRILECTREQLVIPNRWFFPYIVFAMNAGPRQGELLGLYWSDYQPASRRMAITRRYQVQLKNVKDGTKGGGGRFIPLNENTLMVLDTLQAATPAPAKSDLIFRQPNGERISTKAISDIHRRICRIVGLADTIRPYDITRHKYASKITAKYGLRAAQSLLGHASAATTERYAHDDKDHLIHQALDVVVGGSLAVRQ